MGPTLYWAPRLAQTIDDPVPMRRRPGAEIELVAHHRLEIALHQPFQIGELCVTTRRIFPKGATAEVARRALCQVRLFFDK
jgi:hypothetical protein